MTPASRSSLAWGREATVSLTQTEIMLVLAVVVLLLLLVKDEDLAVAKDDLRETEERIVALMAQDEMSEEAIIEQREQAELAREVKEVLVRRESASYAARDRKPALLPEDVQELRRIVEETPQRNDEAALVNAVLERLGPEVEPGDGTPRSMQEQIDQLDDAVALARAFDEHLSPDRQEALRSALERDDANSVAGGDAVRDLLSQWLPDAAKGDGQSATSLGDQVGFDPCWPRQGDRSERRYYIAYDVTYANSRYAVKPHSDWQAGVPIVNQALAGPLSVLRNYPREPVTPDELLESGQRIEAAVDSLRKNGTYPPKCLLVATINEEASGAVAKFLRHRVGIYPITR